MCPDLTLYLPTYMAVYVYVDETQAAVRHKTAAKWIEKLVKISILS